MTDKQQIRATIAVHRKILDPKWRSEASAQIIRNVCTLNAFRTAQKVALYLSFGGEVDLDPLFAECQKLGIQTCIPLFNPQIRRYEMSAFDFNMPYQTGHYGIREPVKPVPVELAEIDFMVVPGVAFDMHGNRLGRGGGYYDRLLTDFKGHAAGVAFGFQLVPTIPVDEHDRPVHTVVTEIKIYNP